MSILLLLLAPGLIGLYWLIRLQICLSRARYLIDAYGLNRKKLQKLKCKELRVLRESIETLKNSNNPSGLEVLIQPYR
ncbi:hypothetical protein TUM22923_05420 [Polynucleobacter sp. TUM22923]|uniref:hypothetical protein n=1 Tax=Polynucleobacter sp. TUM22923 TaxID=3022126 RepID=UPI0025724161|nr:hypothetical protein [Polynucleobacter sp. TUM22923]BDX21221.1 hypothetical protein TUM22923_05420 [Polynucleobacter sp. TUM22923]